MKKNVIFIVLIFSYLISNSQERKIEKIFSECYFKTMPENGKQVKKYYKSYESLLISNGLLKNNSGESYYELFKKILIGKLTDSKTNYSLIDSINGLNYSNLIHSNKKCTDKIKLLKEYKKSNSYIFEKRMDSIKRNSDPEKAFEVILNTLDYRDFEIEFYKLRVLLLLEMNKPMTEFDFDKPEYSKKRIENSLSIYLSKENIITIDQKLISKVEFENIVKNYLLSNKALSLIKINSSRDDLYSEYIKLIEHLNSIFSKLKNEISADHYNKKYEDLTKTETELIEKEYSFEIYEKEPK